MGNPGQKQCSHAGTSAKDYRMDNQRTSGSQDVTDERAYVLSEGEYQRMRKDEIRSWNERNGTSPIEADVERFLTDVLSLEWVPKTGKAIELGCGTAPIARWLAGRGWSVTGVDVSPTAIEMARAQTDTDDVEFIVSDVTNMAEVKDGTFDLAVDGLCSHYITEVDDRTTFLRETYRILKPGGCFVLMSMALPILPDDFRRMHGVIEEGKILAKCKEGQRYKGAVLLEDEWYIPVSRLEHWQDLLQALQHHDIEPRLFRVALCHPEDPLSYIAIAALRR